jgi:glycosyltransferase involved in cell wall biosynthesis
VTRVLLVTQSTRSIGEFRRPWVRALDRRYVARFRREVAAAVRALARDAEVTALTSRELVDAGALADGVDVHFFHDESYRVSSDDVEAITTRLTRDWWPSPARAPSLVYRGVWLPDVLAVARAIVLRLEIAEPLATIDGVCDEVRPDAVVLLHGASIPERLARCVAERRRLPVSVASPRFVWARLYARACAALFPREERLRLRSFLDHPRRTPPPRRPRAGERVLFVTCRPRHHYLVDPLVAALADAGAETHVVASPNREPEMGTRLRALGEAGVAWSTLVDYLPLGDALRLVRRYRPLFRRVWRRVERDPRFAERLAWNGIALHEVARPFLRDSVEKSLLSALICQEAAFRAVEALEPSAVVVTSNRRHAERAMAQVARARRLPCLLFSGTLVLGRDPSHRFDVGDRVVVIGNYLRERLVAEKLVDAARISVVGDPRSNAARLVAPARLREEVVADFGLAPGRPLLVMVSKYVSLLFSAEEKERFYRTVAGAVALLEAPNVIVKIHPNEDLALVREQAREWGWSAAVLTKEYDIHRLFGAADVAIMVTSMAGIEAMALGCPVVAVHTPGKDFEGQGTPPYVSAGVVRRVELGDPARLAAAVRGLLEDGKARADLVERARRFAARYVHPVDGALAARLLAVVDDIRSAAGARPAP